MRRRLAVLFVVLGFFYAFNLSMAAESGYPTKPIELLIGYAPGGGTDLGARMVAEQAKKYLGQEIIPVNKPGGGGRIAMTLLVKAKPDGYTLGAVTDSGLNWVPHLEEVPYKPFEDFTFIIQYGMLYGAIIVSADSPFKTFKDIIQFSRANPHKLTCGTVGAGSSSEVVFQALQVLEDLKIQLVPFSGAAAAMTALLGGHIMVASTASSGFSNLVKAKKVRLLGLTTEERRDEYPDVPTLKELGYPLLALGGSSYLLSGPKNMDKAVVKKLGEVFRKAMETPEFTNTAKELEIYLKNPLSDDELRGMLLRRNASNEKFFRQLGMGIKR